MATMIDGESYLGRVMVRPLTKSGDITLFLWPVRCLKSKMGGPTFGVDVKGEEIIRFDPHGPRGHWHQGGYDKLGAGGSHTEFRRGLGTLSLKSPGPWLKYGKKDSSCSRKRDFPMKPSPLTWKWSELQRKPLLPIWRQKATCAQEP